MEDEWFKEGIEDYLLPPDLSKTKHKKIEIDEDVISALTNAMGYDRDEIINVINKCNEHNSPQQLSNEIIDAYLLMKENHTLVKDLKKTHNEKMDNFLSSSPPPSWNASINGTPNPNTPNPHAQQHGVSTSGPGAPSHRAPGVQQSLTYQTLAAVPDLSTLPNLTIAILPSSLPLIHRALMANNSDPNQAKINAVLSKKLKTRWHFGIRSRSYPLDVMGEIYRALKNLGAEWSVPTEEELWTIRVRWKYGPCIVEGRKEENDAATASGYPDMMKMQIQLFQLEPNNYLVDFKFDGWENHDQEDVQMEGDTTSAGAATSAKQDVDEMSSFSAYPFLHLATRLIMELAVNSQST